MVTAGYHPLTRQVVGRHQTARSAALTHQMDQSPTNSLSATVLQSVLDQLSLAIFVFRRGVLSTNRRRRVSSTGSAPSITSGSS